MMLVTWPRWPPTLYMVKKKIKNLLRNKWTRETLYAALGTLFHHSMFKWWPWVDLDLFYDKVKFCNIGFSVGKSEESGHTLPDSGNVRVTDNKILIPFVTVRMRFLSVPHAVNVFHVRWYPFCLASFGHVQNFKRTPSDYKNLSWLWGTDRKICPKRHSFKVDFCCWFNVNIEL